jgi:hypothetical protein
MKRAMAKGYADDLSIDRIDNTKGYHPGNCRWATAVQQNQNRTICKFTAESVIGVRERHASGEARQRLAEEFGVHPVTINNVVSGRTWKNIEQPASAVNTGV